MLKFALFLLLFPFSLLAQNQSGQLFLLQDSWTNDQIGHSIYGYFAQDEAQQDTANLVFFSKGLIADRKQLIIQPTPFSVIQYQLALHTGIHIDSCVFRLSSGRPVSYKVSQYIMSGNSVIKYSPLITFQKKWLPGNLSYKLPSTYFNPDSDSLFLSSSSEFFPKGKGNRLGYRFFLFSSNQDTVLRFSKNIPDSVLRRNVVAIGLKKIPSGRYEIQFDYLINNTVVGTSTVGPVYILTADSNKKIKPEKKENSDLSSEFSSFTEEELDDFAEKSRYLGSSEENLLYSQLKSVSQKKQFLGTFWNKRSGDPDNNLYNYLEKLSLIDSKYGGSGKKGYKTDRGRIFLKYGKCDDIYISSSITGIKPFEVWYYPSVKGQNSVYFYFVDQSGYGDYQLVHSNAHNEVYNPSILVRLGIDQTNYRQ